MEIRSNELEREDVSRFLAEHLAEMHRVTPPGCVHALDLADLRAPEVQFWSIREQGRLVGCGALKLLGDGRGEIKSMRTDPRHRGRGVASRLLGHIIDQAHARGLHRLYLETGSLPAFKPARDLYLRHGFRFCAPFADYRQDPNSSFMTLALPVIPR